ncbi:MAG: hypothetical protein KC420_06855 [Myxococcales bacterium]|nr:hypothetical protein [Myxococcales bacterium]
MGPEEAGALLSAAGVGWVRFRDGADVGANAAAQGFGLDVPMARWRELLPAAERDAFDDALAGLVAGAAPRVLRVRLDGGGAARVLRLTLRRPSDQVVDALIVDETDLAVAERDLAEAEELISLLPAHVFWEAADVSRQRTLQSRLEEMVAERTAELQRQIAERERAERAALAASRAKSEFLTNISHELRTPLNVVLGYAELILDEISAGEADLAAIQVDVERIALAGGFLLQLVTQLLDLSRIEAGKMDLLEDVIELGPWIGELASTFEGMARSKRNRYEVVVEPGIGAIVADGLKLRRILSNLLSNACKFTERGSIELKVSGLDGGRRIQVEVRDTGVGISEERLSTIFDPFVQASLAAACVEGRTGLGLAMSRRYAELMGGTLSVESELGCGTTLSLVLPRRRQADV